MNVVLNKTWDTFLGPILRRPKRLQVAALCHQGTGDDRKFLLVTSRETKRWIVPKGWPIRGLKSSEAALQEAWEEAGVKHGNVTMDPIGTYTYQKRLSTGWSFPVETLVYAVAVEDLSEQFPEADERTRRWVGRDDAIAMVQEEELREIFRDFAERVSGR